MTCGKNAEKIVVIGGARRVKDSEAAAKLAALRKCGYLKGRFGFVCSRDCAVAHGWLW